MSEKLAYTFNDDAYYVSQSFHCQMIGIAIFYLKFTKMEPIIHMLCRILWNKVLILEAQRPVSQL